MARPRNFDEQEVLHRAMELFWEKGYHATSVQDLVEQLGINRASMYDTFGDKHQLFVTALKHYRGTTGDWLVQLMRSDFPIRDKLRTVLINGAKKADPESDGRGCFIVNAICELSRQDAEVDDFSRRHLECMVDSIEGAIRQAQERGEISTANDPRTLALHFFSTYNGMIILSQSGADCDSLLGVVEMALSVLDH